MPKRIIVCPEPVLLEPFGDSDEEPQIIEFVDFVKQLLNQPVFAKTYKAIRTASAIDQSFKDNATGTIHLAEEDWVMLCDVTKEPPAQGYGYSAYAMRTLLPFLDTIVNAEVDIISK